MLPEAVKDLPDPLDPRTKAIETDDLLAQMADEAINKLMADADRDDMPMRVARPVAKAPAPAPIVVQEAEPSPVETSAVETTPVETAPTEAEATIAAILNESIQATPTPTPTPTAEAPLIDVPPATIVDAHHAVPESVEIIEAHDEPPTPAADVKALLADHDNVAPSRGGVLLLPLRIINAPFDLLGDGIRNAMGQIAIVTLINAVAVIAYVLIFHRHH